MTHIIIEIEADGDSCGKCQFAKYQKQHCPFVNKGRIVDEGWFHRFHRLNKRLSKCLAAEIPVGCGTCDSWRGSCVHEEVMYGDRFKLCMNQNYKHWKPPVRGKHG